MCSAGSSPESDAETVETGQEPTRDPLVELTEAVSALTAQVQQQHARAEARERVIDRLHTEVERFKLGEQALFLRPIITDLQNLRTDLLHQAETLPDGVSRKQAAALLESFALSIELALERCGSVPIRPAAGAPFSAREHRAVKIVPARSPDQDETISAVVADGYWDTATDRVTTPARVHVHRWTSSETPATGQEESVDA